MLFGNMIFIKKTGGDGSKYPVTQRNIKIGRSENCLIRIYNPQVAPEHCQLIIDDNGQAKLRNLSYCTILNGKPLSQGDVTLCHGDVFKLGERLARWEYLPSSKYYKQPLSPSGRLVAVVMPQQRSTAGTPGASTSQVSISKSTPVGSKRRYSENITSAESISAKKVSRMSSTSKAPKNLSMTKFLTGRHSLKGAKALLQSSKVKQRKSTTGVVSAKTPKTPTVERHRKSTLPSWKVNIVTPPSAEKSVERRSVTGRVSTPIVGHEKFVKSVRKSTVKASLRTIVESPSKQDSPKSTRSTGRSPSASSPSKVSVSTPKEKPSVKPVRLVHSERKSKPSGKSPRKSIKLKRMSLILERVKTPRISEVKKLYESASQKKRKTSKTEVVDSKLSGEMLPTVNLVDDIGSFKTRTPRKGEVISVKNTPVKKTPRKSVKTPSSSKGEGLTPDQEKVASTRRRLPEKSPALKSPTVDSSPARGRSLSEKTPSAKKSSSPSEAKSSSPRGVRRKLTPSISSAERAAKKLKTSSPRKPDKNKKAALLVLGKANRKQIMSQNVKVLLKQKIVKKAIKQSIMPPVRKDEKVKKPAKVSPKTASKRKKKPTKKAGGKKKVAKSGEAAATSSKSPSAEKVSKSVEGTPRNKKETEENLLNTSKLTSPRSFANKTPATEEKSPLKSPSRQGKKSPGSVSISFSPKTTPIVKSLSPPVAFDKSSESYLFASNRRSSKRLSSKNNTSRPDFMELSPTALGLIPKNLEIFKTPKEKKRRSSSLTTPKSVRTAGIIKSASTSKITHRKSVRFSSKDVSISSTFGNSDIMEEGDYGLDSFRTPNVTLDLFVSPLTEASKANLNLSSKATTDDRSKGKGISSSNKTSSAGSTPKKCVRKLLQSPQVLLRQSTKTDSPQVPKVQGQTKTLRVQRSPKNDLTDVEGVRQLFKPQESPKNDLSDVKGIRRLLRTPKEVKSPKNDLTDVRGVKKLLETPKVQKSPKNDLTDIKGVKKLLQTPKVQKSPKNDLTDIRGVKKLLRTPKEQKSPKNDLTDVRGVKKLLRTPKEQKSPKNDLTDVRGVKKLLRTPKLQKSPKNDLSDIKGVKKLLRTPKVSKKSPKNDLSDVRGVKQLMKSPKTQKGPKNDLSDLTGVPQLFKSPRAQKSPKNDLTDVRGIRRLLRSPKVQKSPRNDLSNVSGVKKLLQSPRTQKSPKNDLMDVSGVGQLFQSPKVEKSPAMTFKTEPQMSPRSSTTVTGVKQLLIAKSPEIVLKSKKSPRKSHMNDFRAIRGRRTIYSTPKGPKNDLSDLTGVRELFARHKPISDYNISLTGVAELFDLPTSKTEVHKPTKRKSSPKKSTGEILEVDPDVSEEETVTRTGRSRKNPVVEKRSTRSRRGGVAEVVITEVTGKASTKRKAAAETKTPAPKQTRGRKTVVESEKENKPEGRTRKRKATDTESEDPSPPKTRKRQADKKTVSFETPKISASQSKTKSRPAETSSVKRTRTTAKAKDSKIPSEVQTKTATKAGSRSVSAKAKENKSSKVSSRVQTKATKAIGGHSKVQKRSQSNSSEIASESEEKISPRKTRSVRTKVESTGRGSTKAQTTKTVETKASKASKASKTSKSVAVKTRLPQVLKRSTRRK